MLVPHHDGFLSINELVNNQGELALILKFDHTQNVFNIEACAQLLADVTQKELMATYFLLCDSDSPTLSPFFSDSDVNVPRANTVHISIIDSRTPLTIFAGKKYKPVAQKIRPIETELPSHFRIIHNIKGDPLANLLQLSSRPPDFAPQGHYTQERMEQFTTVHEGNFLLPKEKKLLHHFMSLQNGTFAWTDQVLWPQWRPYT